MRRALILFDIDGTLLLSGRAGLRAMTRAFEQAPSASTEAFAGEHFGGRTDSYLVSKALQGAGMPDTLEQHDRFRESLHPASRRGDPAPRHRAQGTDAGREASCSKRSTDSTGSAPRAADRQLSRGRRDQAAALRAVATISSGARFRRRRRGSQCARADREEPRRDLRHSASRRSSASSSSATRRTTSNARASPARARSRSRPAATRWSSCESSAPTTCCRFVRHRSSVSLLM